MNSPDSILSDEIVVVGEYTTPSGPWADDIFLVILFVSGRWEELSLSEARPLLPEIEKKVGAKIDFSLCNVTDFSSIVHYPEKLAGRRLYDFAKEEDGLIGSLKAFFRFGVVNVTRRITAEVREYVAAHAAAGSER